jgi:hypothetical protein
MAAELPEPNPPNDEQLRRIRRWFEVRLAAIALAVGIGVIFATFSKAIADPLPNSVVFLFRELAVALVIAAFAAVLVPQFMKKEELKDALIDYVKKDIRRAINDQTQKIEAQTTALFEGAASLGTLHKVHISRVYASRTEADLDISKDLERPRKEIRVLGLSLNDMMGRNAPLRQTWTRLCRAITEGNPPTADVKVLVIDPHSLGAALRAHSEGTSAYEAFTLKTDVANAVQQLEKLKQQHYKAGGSSFDFRLYRTAPQLFLCWMDSVAYMQPYYYRRPLDDRVDEPPLPLVRSAGEGLLEDLHKHFELIWDFASMSAAQYLGGHAVGLDEGAWFTAIRNVFSTSGEAAWRMKWLMRQAAESASKRDAQDLPRELSPLGEPHAEKPRLWLQGISLDSYFDDEHPEHLWHEVLGAVESGVDVRILALHPYSAQAYYRTYREFVLGRRSNGARFSDYCKAQHWHDHSKLVTDASQTIDRILALRKDGRRNIQIRLYACAPSCFLLLTDDRAMIEQYHYGKDRTGHIPPDRIGLLGKGTPLVEYKKIEEEENRGPYGWRPSRSPYDLLKDHFEFVWNSAADATKADLEPAEGRIRAAELEFPLGFADRDSGASAPR